MQDCLRELCYIATVFQFDTSLVWKIGWQVFFPGGRLMKNMQLCLISQ